MTTINTSAALYQWIEKEHMEEITGETITAEQWRDFLNHFQTSFAKEVSELAANYWTERSS